MKLEKMFKQHELEGGDPIKWEIFVNGSLFFKDFI